MVGLVSNMNVTEQTNENGLILSICLEKLKRHFKNEFLYGGKISRSQFNFIMSQFRLNRDELKVLLSELTNHYPFLIKYKRGIKIKPNGGTK